MIQQYQWQDHRCVKIKEPPMGASFFVSLK
nr:MAG TPA: hypothetical protein [Caudoviricetes sp.]